MLFRSYVGRKGKLNNTIKIYKYNNKNNKDLIIRGLIACAIGLITGILTRI